MCKSALLFSKRDYVLSDALRYICRNQRINLIYAITFPELLHHVITSNPEVIFFDAECIDFSFDLYKDFVETRCFEMPKIIIFSLDPQKHSFKDDNIFVVDKKCYSEEVERIMHNIEEKKSRKLGEEKLEEYRQKTIKLLIELGITTKYLGYEYIKELVVDIIKDKRMLKSFNKKLYPQLAVKYNTQVNNIERNIRNAINIAKRNCQNKDLYEKSCGRLTDLAPSNKQFITWMVEEVS